MTEERNVWIKICRECGKPFETETYQTLYCSEECKKAGAKKSASSERPSGDAGIRCADQGNGRGGLRGVADAALSGKG